MNTNIKNPTKNDHAEAKVAPSILIKSGDMTLKDRNRLEEYIAKRRLEGDTLLVPEGAVELIIKGLDSIES